MSSFRFTYVPSKRYRQQTTESRGILLLSLPFSQMWRHSGVVLVCPLQRTSMKATLASLIQRRLQSTARPVSAMKAEAAAGRKRFQQLPAAAPLTSTASASASAAGASQLGIFARVVRWFARNMFGLVAYQMLLDTVVTGAITAMLLSEWCSVEDIQRQFASASIPADWVDWTGGVHTEPFGGIDARLMTAIHCAHNISWGLTPLQLAFLLVTYPLAMRMWAVSKPFVLIIPGMKTMFSTPSMHSASWLTDQLGATKLGKAVEKNPAWAKLKGWIKARE